MSRKTDVAALFLVAAPLFPNYTSLLVAARPDAPGPLDIPPAGPA
jgi:hypothetical protein